MLDFILCRYHDPRYILELEASQGFKIISKGYEKYQEERLYIQWLHDDARYTVNFDEYKKKIKPYRKSTEQEKNEILKEFGGV